MKKFLPWLKSHWLIVVLSVVALAALPVAIFFSQSMQASTQKSFEDQVKKDFDSVSETAAKISYKIPAVDGTGSVLEQTKPANETMIKAYGEIWQQVQGKVGGVAETGLKFNKADHKLLAEGLFPKPAEDGMAALTVKGREFIGALIAFHKQILTDARAGAGPKAVEIAQQLTDYSNAQVERVRNESGREMNDDEKKRLGEELRNMRLGALARRAGEVSFYADPSVFVGVPTDVPDRAPTLAQAWEMQEKAWLHADLIRALAAANGSNPVTANPVKRLIKISARPAAWAGDTTGAVQAAAYDPGEDKAPLDFAVSITGRHSGPGSKNKWYDVRKADVDLIVSSSRLPVLFDSLASTNFFTVLDLSVTNVDPIQELREGHFYGDDHVVRVSLVLESVWLREWRKAYMPLDVQKALGMVEGVEGAAAPVAAPPPRSRPGGAPAGPPGGRPGGRPPRDG